MDNTQNEEIFFDLKEYLNNQPPFFDSSSDINAFCEEYFSEFEIIETVNVSKNDNGKIFVFIVGDQQQEIVFALTSHTIFVCKTFSQGNGNTFSGKRILDNENENIDFTNMFSLKNFGCKYFNNNWTIGYGRNVLYMLEDCVLYFKHKIYRIPSFGNINYRTIRTEFGEIIKFNRFSFITGEAFMPKRYIYNIRNNGYPTLDVLNDTELNNPKIHKLGLRDRRNGNQNVNE